MQIWSCRAAIRRGIVIALSWTMVFDVASWAGDVQLRNGTRLNGSLHAQFDLASRPIGLAEMRAVRDEAPKGNTIGRVDNGWQRFYFPFMQIQAPEKHDSSVGGPSKDSFTIKQAKQSKNLTVASFGSITYIDPFDEFGRRRVTIETDKKPLHVFQGITEVTPDHITVDSLNCHWKFGLPLKTVPFETLDKLLKKQLKREDANGRLALVYFYTKAEYYPAALAELAAITQDFPDKKPITSKLEDEVMNYFGTKILLRLEHRKRAGQHQLAESMSKGLANQTLKGATKQDVQQYVRNYEQARQSIERAKLLLSDWQEKVTDNQVQKRLEPMRSAINEQLNFETLPRLDAFLKSESDSQYEPSQRLGLAYTGWILGPANAVPDLDQAFRVWEARNFVLEYLRSEDPSEQAELLKKLQTTENISANTVLYLTAQLPPILDSGDIEAETLRDVNVTDDGQIRYSVILPPEYSPQHKYPMLVALRPRTRTTGQIATIWAGDKDSPDYGNQRGYIVIAPEYAEKTAGEYTYGAPAHKAILDCVIDARKRFSVDSDRVYLAGHGMGADAAFDIGMAHPDEFAGVLPLGGNALHYCKHIWENSAYTAWYVVGKGYDVDGGRDNTSNRVFDHIMKRGIKSDFLLVEYLGRNGENVFDDLPKLYDWMDLHVRGPMPRQFKVSALRKTDNRYFWVTANGLPRDYVLPAPHGEDQRISPMDIEVNILVPGNIISLKSPTDGYSLRLTPDLVDFDRKLIVKAHDKILFRDFVKPDIKVLLDELAARGDRNRLPLALIEP